MKFNNLDNRLPSHVTLSEDRRRRLEEIHQRLVAGRRRQRKRERVPLAITVAS